MSVSSRARTWIRSIRHRDRIDADLHRELSDWVEELAARYEAEGTTPVSYTHLTLPTIYSV